MSKTIYELLSSHCSIFESNLQNVKSSSPSGKITRGIFQLDFLAWYVDSDRITTYGVPGFTHETGIKDNPNRVPTDYQDVYIKTEYHGDNVAIDYQLVIPGKSPIAIMNRWYFKVRVGKNYEYRWRVSVYGKALKLYYMGYIPRLMDYIIKYNGECCRADLCRDFPFDLPDGIIDLSLTGTNHKTRYYGEKNSPLFFRIYDKTQDLRREKNCFAWLYPLWYQKECWRLECQLTGQYSRSMNPLDWLDVLKVDKSKIQKIESLQRNVYKTALYSVINTVEWVNLGVYEKIEILKGSKKVIENKITKLSRSIL